MRFIKTFFQAIPIAIQITKWLIAQNKLIEQNADEYFTKKRALEWRLMAEKMFWVISQDNYNFASIPKPIKWLLGKTRVDNRVAFFGLHLLKSTKIKERDPVLDKPIATPAKAGAIYPAH